MTSRAASIAGTPRPATGITWRPERRLVSPDPGHVVIQDALVTVHVVRHDELLPEDVRQTPVGALRSAYPYVGLNTYAPFDN